MAREYSKALYKSIRDYAQKEGWRGVKEDAENGTIATTFRTDTKLKSVDLKILALGRGIVSYGTIPFSADKETLDAAAEFVARANYGLNHGNFELDFRDGELRYKSSLYCDSQNPSPADVDWIIDLPLHMWEKYGNALLSVLIGGETPEAAVAAAER